MRCPNCGAAGETELKVIDSRPIKGDTSRRRRYACKCKFRFTTLEVYAEANPRGKKVVPALKLSAQQLAVVLTIKENVNTLLELTNSEQ